MPSHEKRDLAGSKIHRYKGGMYGQCKSMHMSMYDDRSVTRSYTIPINTMYDRRLSGEIGIGGKTSTQMKASSPDRLIDASRKYPLQELMYAPLPQYVRERELISGCFSTVARYIAVTLWLPLGFDTSETLSRFERKIDLANQHKPCRRDEREVCRSRQA
eukprot:scaffold20882_cov139-Skeletonema_marinoi.AAC.6